MRSKLNTFLFRLYLLVNRNRLSIGQMEELTETEELLDSRDVTIPLIKAVVFGR